MMPPDGFLSLVNRILGELEQTPNPWTADKLPPNRTFLPTAIADVESSLGLQFPIAYRHFLARCSTHLIGNGFLIPWQGPRNIVDFNDDFPASKSLTFWHEEDGSLFLFRSKNGEFFEEVFNESGVQVADDFNSFLTYELTRWLSNSISRHRERIATLEQLNSRLLS